MTNIVLFAICAFFGFFSIGSCIVAERERSERKQAEKEARENAKKAAKIITEANKTKAEASRGDIGSNLDYMANKLHEYATK